MIEGEPLTGSPSTEAQENIRERNSAEALHQRMEGRRDRRQSSSLSPLLTPASSPLSPPAYPPSLTPFYAQSTSPIFPRDSESDDASGLEALNAIRRWSAASAGSASSAGGARLPATRDPDLDEKSDGKVQKSEWEPDLGPAFKSDPVLPEVFVHWIKSEEESGGKFETGDYWDGDCPTRGSGGGDHDSRWEPDFQYLYETSPCRAIKKETGVGVDEDVGWPGSEEAIGTIGEESRGVDEVIEHELMGGTAGDEEPHVGGGSSAVEPFTTEASQISEGSVIDEFINDGLSPVASDDLATDDLLAKGVARSGTVEQSEGMEEVSEELTLNRVSETKEVERLREKDALGQMKTLFLGTRGKTKRLGQKKKLGQKKPLGQKELLDSLLGQYVALKYGLGPAGEKILDSPVVEAFDVKVVVSDDEESRTKNSSPFRILLLPSTDLYLSRNGSGKEAEGRKGNAGGEGSEINIDLLEVRSTQDSSATDANRVHSGDGNENAAREVFHCDSSQICAYSSDASGSDLADDAFRNDELFCVSAIRDCLTTAGKKRAMHSRLRNSHANTDSSGRQAEGMDCLMPNVTLEARRHTPDTRYLKPAHLKTPLPLRSKRCCTRRVLWVTLEWKEGKKNREKGASLAKPHDEVTLIPLVSRSLRRARRPSLDV